MTEEAIIKEIKFKRLNEKCNHYIFAGLRESEIENIISHIPPKSFIPNYEDITFALSSTTQIKYTSNIFVDLKNIEIESLLNVILDFLKIKERISFLDRKSLMRLRGVLREQQQCIQLIVPQKQILDIEKQIKFNELFAFNSYFINITCLLKEGCDFSTYQTLHGEMLDDRENYQKIHITRYGDYKQGE